MKWGKTRANLHCPVQEFPGAPENTLSRQGIPVLPLADNALFILGALVSHCPSCKFVLQTLTLEIQGWTYVSLLCKCTVYLSILAKIQPSHSGTYWACAVDLIYSWYIWLTVEVVSPLCVYVQAILYRPGNIVDLHLNGNNARLKGEVCCESSMTGRFFSLFLFALHGPDWFCVPLLLSKICMRTFVPWSDS